jgi:hypothetical protein
MQIVGKTERFVIAREDNVVRVDFRKSDPPAPDFPGAGGMRVLFDVLGGDSEVGRIYRVDGWSDKPMVLERQLPTDRPEKLRACGLALR